MNYALKPLKKQASYGILKITVKRVATWAVINELI
jgi:hypothetical protein